jgi:hypothetical protein
MTNMPLPCASDHWDFGFPGEFCLVLSNVTSTFDTVLLTLSFQLVLLP